MWHICAEMLFVHRFIALMCLLETTNHLNVYTMTSSLPRPHSRDTFSPALRTQPHPPLPPPHTSNIEHLSYNANKFFYLHLWSIMFKVKLYHYSTSNFRKVSISLFYIISAKFKTRVLNLAIQSCCSKHSTFTNGYYCWDKTSYCFFVLFCFYQTK